MKVKMNKVFNWFSLLPPVIGVGCIVFMLYVFFWPPYPAYVVSKPETHTVRYYEGTIRIHRAYCINYQRPIIVNRELIRVGASGEPELRITLPSTIQAYELGCHEIERIFEIPRGTPAGNYRLRFTAVWQANPFRQDSVELPELSVAIEKDGV